MKRSEVLEISSGKRGELQKECFHMGESCLPRFNIFYKITRSTGDLGHCPNLPRYQELWEWDIHLTFSQ